MKGEEKREAIQKLIASLAGSSRNLDEACASLNLEPTDPEVTAALDEVIFECECCGWWCERGEESTAEPSCCDECKPNDGSEGD